MVYSLKQTNHIVYKGNSVLLLVSEFLVIIRYVILHTTTIRTRINAMTPKPIFE